MLTAKDGPKPAEEFLQGLLARVPDDAPEKVDYWVAMAALSDRQGQPQEALNFLEKAKKKRGDQVDMRLARAAHWSRQSGEDAAAALKELSQGLEKFKPIEQRQLRRGLAEAFSRVGNLRDAREAYAQLEGAGPNDLATKLALFDLAVKEKDQALMTRLIRDMQLIEEGGSRKEEGTLWRYAEAMQLILQAQEARADSEGLKRARRHLTQVAARRPAWYRVATCQALLEDVCKNEAATLRYSLRAIDLGESNPVVVFRAVQLLYKNNRTNEAAALMRKLPERVANQSEFKGVAIEMFLRAGDKDSYGKALELAKNAVAADKENFRNHIQLANVLWATDPNSLEVEPELRQAVALAGKNPDAWAPLIDYLIRRGRKGDAEAEVSNAEKELSREEHATPLAAFYQMVGRTKEAKDLYLERLKVKPKDAAVLQSLAALHFRLGEREEGERYLRALAELRSEAPQQAESASRMLRMLKLMGGDYVPSEKLLAEAGLGGAREGRPAADDDSVEDLRAKAVVLIARGTRADSKLAISVLERIRQREPLAPQDQLILCRLYETVNDWRHARDEALSLLTKDGENLSFLAYYALTLLRHNEIEEAQTILARIEQLEEVRKKTPFVVVEIKARLLSAKDKTDKAVDEILAHVEKNQDSIGTAARLLEQLKRPDKAEPLYRQLASRPKAAETAGLILAQFLSRQGKAEEAMTLCEKAAAKAPPGLIAEVSVEVAYRSLTDRLLWERAARLIESARDKSPNSAALTSRLAAMRNRQERYEESIKLYRQVVTLDARDVLALNNLAFLLSYQTGKSDDALSVIQRAFEIKGPLPDLLDTRALIRLNQGSQKDAVEAIKDLQAANAEIETSAAHFHLAQAYQMVEKRGQARSAFQRAVALGLTEASLHPLERPMYQRLRKELGER
jgi:tetratricopeptide (TPR) repeat protein